MNLPQHVTPRNSGRQATSPYNFVPLPEGIFLPDEEPFKAHDRCDPARLHGTIELELYTETPLYIRCAYPPSEEDQDPLSSAERQQFYHHGDRDKPVLPGTSLRGMLRSLVEILSYARPTRRSAPGEAVRIYDTSLMHRAVADQQTPVGQEYNARFLQSRPSRGNRRSFTYPHPNVRGGYLERDGSDWQIRPAREIKGSTFVRVKTHVLEERGIPQRENTTQDVWVRPQPVAHHPSSRVDLWYARTDDISTRQTPGWERGALVCSGPMGTRHMHTVVYGPDPAAKPVNIPRAMWAQFAADRDLHRGIACRKITKPGDPLFYLLDEQGQLVFLGPTLFFRVPYTTATCDFIPASVMGGEAEKLDLAEALFGTVNGERDLDNAHTGAHRGRVSVDDALLHAVTGGGSPFFPGEGTRYPAILSTPKPTSFQHYLTQDDGNGDQHRLRSYSERDRGKAVLRGTKLYWHRGGPGSRELLTQRPRQHVSQYTAIRPVRPGVVFRGRIRFENLSALELRALLYAVELPRSCRHRLGMGKPHGMGSVRIQSQVTLIDPALRYSALSAIGRVSPEEQGERLQAAREAFRSKIVAFYNMTVTSPHVPPEAEVWKIPRLGELRHLLKWEGRPPRARTEYQALSRFRARPVLPTPSAVMGNKDPQVRVPIREQVRTQAQAGGPRPAVRPAAESPEESAALRVVGGRVVRFQQTVVRIQLDEEDAPRKVPLHVYIFPKKAWKRLSGGTLYPKRRVKITLKGDDVVQVVPEG